MERRAMKRKRKSFFSKYKENRYNLRHWLIRCNLLLHLFSVCISFTANIDMVKGTNSFCFFAEQHMNRMVNPLGRIYEYHHVFSYKKNAFFNFIFNISICCSFLIKTTESDIGGWGPWSDWTPCSTTCAGGTRNRYRVCDSPPPRYGAKFCQVRLQKIYIWKQYNYWYVHKFN